MACFRISPVFLFLVLEVCFCPPNTRAQETATILKVIDGDSLLVSVNGKSEQVRLTGIDAPEISPSEKAGRIATKEKESLGREMERGREAARHMKGLVKPGDRIYLVQDAESRDGYGRLLRYVFLPNGLFLNETMLKDGFAYPLAMKPNTKYKERFKQVYERAKAEKAGLWSSGSHFGKPGGFSEEDPKTGKTRRRTKGGKHQEKQRHSEQTEVTDQTEVSDQSEKFFK